MSFTMDLAKHKEPIFVFLWDSLSPETQARLTEKDVELETRGGLYNPGPEVAALVADLNKLIEGKLIYTDKDFGQIELSGDTLQLLERMPVGEDLVRLNRLLLEDAFQLDILPRPKIIVDPDTKDAVMIDFAKRIMTLHNPSGKELWTADLGPSLDEEFAIFPYSRLPGPPARIRNVGIWDAFFKVDRIVALLRGNAYIDVNLKTGVITYEPHS